MLEPGPKLPQGLWGAFGLPVDAVIHGAMVLDVSPKVQLPGFVGGGRAEPDALDPTPHRECNTWHHIPPVVRPCFMIAV